MADMQPWPADILASCQSGHFLEGHCHQGVTARGVTAYKGGSAGDPTSVAPTAAPLAGPSRADLGPVHPGPGALGGGRTHQDGKVAGATGGREAILPRP